MWLLPVLAPLSRLVMSVYYRASVVGGRVPRRGPVLLVGNHPNALLDPVLLGAAAGRPIRFLAKAPLFRDPVFGWLVRGAGCIPVFRAQDDPAQMARNGDLFRAAHAALVAGSAVAIFPEGISHSEPAIKPLKTGAARIALGAAAAGAAIPIVPVGLNFRDKQRFRSEAVVVVGAEVAWDDLAALGPDSAEAVRQLTARIDDALRDVTVNLQHWEDRALVEAAEAVYSAELGAGAPAATRFRRARHLSTRLAEVRRGDGNGWRRLADELLFHCAALRRGGLRPADLHGRSGLGAAVGWAAHQAAWFATVGLLGALGVVLLWVPYRATGMIGDAAKPTPDARATARVAGGAVAFLVWTVMLAGLAGWVWGWRGAVAAAVAVPALAPFALRVRDRAEQVGSEAQRWVSLRHPGATLARLRGHQRSLAERLERLDAALGGREETNLPGVPR